MDEIGQELRKSEAKYATMNRDLKGKDQAVDTAQKECQYLKTKLHELERALTDSDHSTKQMEEKLKVVYCFISVTVRP